MREIKFRAWDEMSSEWLDQTDYDYFITLDGNVWVAHFTGSLCLDVELNQYTGLKDKNSIDIYEGDIIKVVSDITAKIFVIDTSMGNTVYKLKPSDETGSPVYPTLVTMTKEVIGNIYENKSLLEEN